MNELIKLNETEINNELMQTVNARELHQFLEVGRKFATWIQQRIEKYSFVENEDFLIISKNRETTDKDGKLKVSVAKEYHITLDMAKELSMVERNKKGKQARKYFIECERKLKQVMSTKDSLLLGIFKATGDIDKALAINAYETQYVKPLEIKVEKQAVYIEKAKPKVAFHDATQSSSTVDMDVAAKLLNFKGIGRNKLFGLLRHFKILDKYNRPYQQYVDKGWFKLVETSSVYTTTGDNLVNHKVVLFQKGLDNIHSILIKKGYECLGMISMEDDE